MHTRSSRRNRALALVRTHLARKGSAYFILFFVLAATGLAGFWASVVLRWAGLESMAVRYPVCVALAYLVFLFQLFLFVLTQRSRHHSAGATGAGTAVESEMAVEVVDIGVNVVDASLPSDALSHLAPGAAASASSGNEGSGWFGKWSGGSGGGDDAGAILILLVIVVVVVVALVAGVVALFECRCCWPRFSSMACYWREWPGGCATPPRAIGCSA